MKEPLNVVWRNGAGGTRISVTGENIPRFPSELAEWIQCHGSVERALLDKGDPTGRTVGIVWCNGQLDDRRNRISELAVVLMIAFCMGFSYDEDVTITTLPYYTKEEREAARLELKALIPRLDAKSRAAIAIRKR